MTQQPTILTSPEIRIKHPSEGITYEADFAKKLNGQTIASVGSVSQVIYDTNAAPASGDQLTIGSTSISGTQVIFKVSAGTDGITYGILVPITTNTGDTPIMLCRLQVSAK